MRVNRLESVILACKCVFYRQKIMQRGNFMELNFEVIEMQN